MHISEQRSQLASKIAEQLIHPTPTEASQRLSSEEELDILNSNQNEEEEKQADSCVLPQDERSQKLVRLGPPAEIRSNKYARVEGPVRLYKSFDLPKNMLLSDDGCTVSSYAGYRTVRSSHGTSLGTWMYEVKIEHLEQGMGIRVGWITKDSNLDEPVGADEHGYGYIVQSGDKVHNRKRNNYTGSAKEGDVVGCLIHLPVPGQTFEPRPQDIVRYKGRVHIINDPEVTQNQKKPVENSFVEFYLNGTSLGKAYTRILEGVYYPSVSLYTNSNDPSSGRVQVSVNFGEEWWMADKYTDHCFSTIVNPTSRLCDSMDIEESF